MARIASVRASTKPAKDIASALLEDDKYGAVNPNPALYGVFGQAYANTLSQPQKSRALEAANALTLMLRSNAEANAYREDLAAANATQSELQKRSQLYNVYKAAAERLHGNVDRGYGQETVKIDPYGIPYASPDPDEVDRATRNTLNLDEAERLSKVSTAIKTQREAGINTPDSYVSGQLTPAYQLEPVPVDVGTTPLTPSDETSRYGTDEGMTVEEQMKFASIQKQTEGDEDYAEITMDVTTGGVPTIRYKGDPSQIQNSRNLMRAQGLDPDNGRPLPNTGTQGGGVPKEPAAVTGAINGGVARNPSAFFNQKHLSSPEGKRKDPITGQTRHHDGADYRYPRGTKIPAEGEGEVVFSGQIRGYGNSVKVRYNDGSVIQYSHNNSNLVKVGDRVKSGQPIGTVGSTGRSTGNHVHRRVETAPPAISKAQMYAARFKRNPNVKSVTIIDDETILVEDTRGQKGVFRNGRRVG